MKNPRHRAPEQARPAWRGRLVAVSPSPDHVALPGIKSWERSTERTRIGKRTLYGVVIDNYAHARASRRAGLERSGEAKRPSRPAIRWTALAPSRWEGSVRGRWFAGRARGPVELSRSGVAVSGLARRPAPGSCSDGMPLAGRDRTVPPIEGCVRFGKSRQLQRSVRPR